jgi:hypothetical protein
LCSFFPTVECEKVKSRLKKEKNKKGELIRGDPMYNKSTNYTTTQNYINP